ncbi:MAG: polysaccharide deacetylase family protein [Betaproteobacteria bacterium]|nr:polysaccharide deacetylase family protein [Betaproteobacteria bacterium]
MNPPSRIPILTYHSIDRSGSVLSVAPADFREHMRLLARNGFNGIRFDRLIDALNGNAVLPPNPVVLTFDDAYANFQEHALPALRDAGFGATLFVVAGLVGKSNEWPGQGPSIPRMPLLDWPALREIAQAGIEIGSHTFTHPRLDRTRADQLEQEIAGSRRALEDGAAAPVTTFAYPFGAHSPASVAIVRAHYRAACTTRMAATRPTHDRHLLPRVDAYYLREPRRFARLGTPLGGMYLGARALGRAARAFLIRS